MNNLKTNFYKILEIVKQFSKNPVNERGNITRKSVFSKLSDLEVTSLSLTAEALGIDNEDYLSHKLSKEYSVDFFNLIFRRQYNQRHKLLFKRTNNIKTNIAATIDRGKNYFCVDSKALSVCRFSKSRRCKLEKGNYNKTPLYGYCTAQKTHHHRFKLHIICELSCFIYSFNLIKVSVYDISYLQDTKHELFNYKQIRNRGYFSVPIQLDLFETARIEFSTSSGSNQKIYHPVFKPSARIRKRIEIVSSQLGDQFMLVRDYTKQQAEKIKSITVLQYFNKLTTFPSIELNMCSFNSTNKLYLLLK